MSFNNINAAIIIIITTITDLIWLANPQARQSSDDK